MSDQPFTRQELIDLFWRSDAAEVLAHQWSIARVYVVRNLSLISIHEKAIVPDTYSPRLPYEMVEYYLMGQHFGDICYVAVMHDKTVIVPPFPLNQRTSIPNMYPKESRLASRPGTSQPDF